MGRISYIYPTKRHIKSNQHMDILHEFSNCVREISNHGLSPSEVDWGDHKGEPTKHGPNYTSNVYVLMEVDWGGKLNYTSYRCSMVVDWQAHETHPTGHSISEVDWGGYDPSPNHMNEFLFSEVDWGAHNSSLFLFLVNIDYDAKPKEFSIQGLWGELQQVTPSIPLIELLIDSLATGQTLGT